MNNAELGLLFASLFTGTAYTILIFVFTVGWSRLKQLSLSKTYSTFISIIIPLRNEENNIGGLLQNLLSQHYPKELREFIFINDHSTDDTLGLLKKHSDNSEMKILELSSGSSGKKAAIDYGIQHAKGTLITTLDADCLPGPNWMKTLSTYYEEGEFRMIVGPVAIHQPKGWLASFQALELLSLVATGAGAIGIKKPVMCNGANLSYEKKAYLEVEGFKGNEHIPGGDDMFMMEKFNNEYLAGSIGFAAHPDAIVYSAASGNSKAFLNQRFRWVAKSPAYRNPFLITSALIVLLVNLNLLAAMVFAFISLPGLLIFGSLFLLKCVVDFPILWKASNFAGQTKLMGNYISFQFVYFIFISLSGILGNLFSFSWKERPHKSLDL